MMSSQGMMLLVFGFLLLANCCRSEFVPVFMWGTQGAEDSVPALHKISQSSFTDEIETKLKSNIPRIVIFAEHSLSPEDFGQRDRSGNNAYPNLSKIKQATYLSYVQNPIKATHQASEAVSEISIERLKENFEIPDSRVVIIDLNDASDNERRFDMLKRHDETIATIYYTLVEKYGEVLALYTAHHASWIGSGDVHSRRARALLADATSTTNQFFDNNTLFYYTSGDVAVRRGDNVTELGVTYTATKEGSVVTLSGLNGSFSLSFQFNQTSSGYWYLQQTEIKYDGFNITQSSNSAVYAPIGFSYACSNQTFTGSDFSATFPEFQVEPIYKTSYLTTNGKFDDPYNCVGFTTIPIWSGIFVTFILLLIMTFGLTMMMDIKTMDRFDDAKGKTITINTSE